MITSPLAKNFSDQQLRPLADKLAQLYDFCSTVLNYWNANGGSGILPPAAPTLVAATTGGTLATATYGYKVSALNALGETLASAEATVVVTGPSGKVTLTWTGVGGATSYNVYGRTAGAELFLANVASTYVDTGAATPAGAQPTSNTTGLIPNDSETIADTAATDGRPIVTGAKAVNVVSRAQDIKNFMEGSAAIGVGDGSKAILNTALAYAVNVHG